MMASQYPGKTVAEILAEKRGSIKGAALDPGSPSWDDIRHLTWEEILHRARQRRPGYQTIRKLLSDKEYDK